MQAGVGAEALAVKGPQAMASRGLTRWRLARQEHARFVDRQARTIRVFEFHGAQAVGVERCEGAIEGAQRVADIHIGERGTEQAISNPRVALCDRT